MKSSADFDSTLTTPTPNLRICEGTLTMNVKAGSLVPGPPQSIKTFIPLVSHL